MAIAVSSTTPALVARGATVTNSNVTASFTPPLGALLLAIYMNPSNTAATQNLPTNSAGAVTWDSAVILSEPLTNGVIVSIWGGRVTTSAAMTVTQGISTNSADWAFGVIVVTGQGTLPYGQMQTATSASGTPSATIAAVAGSNSLILALIGNHTNSTIGTPDTGQSQTFGSNAYTTSDAATPNSSWAQYLTGINISQGSSATIDNTAPSSISYAMAMLEIGNVPVVYGVSPNSGPDAGGFPVTISGVGFTGASAVDFGANAATSVTVVNDTTITCVTPAGSDGAVDVTVTTSFGTSVTSGSDKYTYYHLSTVAGGLGETYPGQSDPADLPYISSGTNASASPPSARSLSYSRPATVAASVAITAPSARSLSRSRASATSSSASLTAPSGRSLSRGPSVTVSSSDSITAPSARSLSRASASVVSSGASVTAPSGRSLSRSQASTATAGLSVTAPSARSSSRASASASSTVSVTATSGRSLSRSMPPTVLSGLGAASPGARSQSRGAPATVTVSVSIVSSSATSRSWAQPATRFVQTLFSDTFASGGDVPVQLVFALDQEVVSSAGGDALAQITMVLDVPVVFASGGDVLLQGSLGGDVP